MTFLSVEFWIYLNKSESEKLISPIKLPKTLKKTMTLNLTTGQRTGDMGLHHIDKSSYNWRAKSSKPMMMMMKH